MDTAPPQECDRFAALEAENTTLRSRLQACEQTNAALQSEIAQDKERSQAWQEQTTVAKLNEVIAREQEQAAQSRVTELAKANNVLKESLEWLVKNPDLDSFLDHLLLEITRQVKAAIGQIFLFDANTNTLNFQIEILDGQIYRQPRLAEPELFQAPIPADITPLFQYLCAHQVICLSRDAEEFDRIVWAGTRDWLRREGMSEGVCLALMVGERPVGLIGLGFRDRSTFQPEDLEIIYALTHQAALAIRLTHLAEAAKQAAIAREQEQAAQERVTQLAKANSTLKKTLDVLATEPDLDRTLGHILQVTAEQLGSFSSALWLYNPESDRFSLHLIYLEGEVIAATPETAHRLTGQWIYKRDLDRDLVLKQHIRDRVPVLYALDDHPDITKAQRQYLNRLGVKALLGIPLLLGTEIVGSFTIRFGDRREFQAEELELAQALANQATLAIQLLRMAHQKQQGAIVEERNRMARDIHDSLAQSLTGVVMQLNAATEFLTSKPQQAQACITRAQNLAKQGLTEARRSVWLLYQNDPTACGLPDSLAQLIEQMTSGNDIGMTLSIDGTPYDLDAPVSLNLLRIAQESLTNALRHANPQTIHLHLAYKPQQIQLRVQDDGCGLDPRQTAKQGFGLTGMDYRANVIGAHLQIQSKLGEGTEILVTVPIASS